jgi:hypothetical protein
LKALSICSGLFLLYKSSIVANITKILCIFDSFSPYSILP